MFAQELVVDCELQVVQFVQQYLSSTEVDRDAGMHICKEVCLKAYVCHVFVLKALEV